MKKITLFVMIYGFLITSSAAPVAADISDFDNYEVTLTPSYTEKYIGETATLTVTVLDNGIPVEGQGVYFERWSASAPGGELIGFKYTDSEGKATVSYFSGSECSDTIYSYLQADVNMVRSASVVWKLDVGDDTTEEEENGFANYEVTLTPSHIERFVGETATLTVTVLDSNGNPVAGQGVEFERSSDSSSDIIYGIGLKYTDSEGKATISYSSDSVGSDTIYSHLQADDNYVRSASVIWNLKEDDTTEDDDVILPEFPNIALPIVAVIGVIAIIGRRKQ